MSTVPYTRKFCEQGSAYDSVKWSSRDVVIDSSEGRVFEQLGVEAPTFWTQQACTIVAHKYFAGDTGSPEREFSVRQLVSRVVNAITCSGLAQGYFTAEAAADFEADLAWLILHQYGTFNSPVWFNVGRKDNPVCSACFINSVQDSIESIMDLAQREARIFKAGAGAGSNLSRLRSSKERIAGTNTNSSGPISFMRIYDAVAEVIKSGSVARRAAKMQILDVTHPDIMEFIACKVTEEAKAKALLRAGYDGGVNGGAYSSVHFQNSNISVRVTDEFMRAAKNDESYEVLDRHGKPLASLSAREVLRAMAQSAWVCGDPGIQYDGEIQRMNPSKATDRIWGTNPCVVGSTLVATDEGWRRIDDLVGKTVHVVGLDGQPHLVTEVFPTGRKKVFNLRTRAGYEVQITEDHLVWSLERGDTPVRDLKIGEKLKLAGPGFGRRALGENLALAIGVAVGDGCLARSIIDGREQVVLVTSAQHADILIRISEMAREEKQLRRAVGSVGSARASQVVTSGGISRLPLGAQCVVDLFKEFAVLNEGSQGKKFKPTVFDLDKPTLATVLRGLFTTDVTVGDSRGNGTFYVSLDSTSLDLLKQVQLLLLGFGIKSKLYTERRGGSTEALLPDGRGGKKLYPVREMHSLRISRSSRFIFQREIGFDPASPKAAALQEVNSQFGAYKDELSDEIVEITPLGEEDVFDLREMATHHFVANGLVVHNCSEFVFLDETSCNLASLNLMAFWNGETFQVDRFEAAVRTFILAMDIIVGMSGYPTEKIREMSHRFRPLGLGYANLGSLLLVQGIPYGSPQAMDLCSGVTALMSAAAFSQSQHLASIMGAYEGLNGNEEHQRSVIEAHRRWLPGIPGNGVARERASSLWSDVLKGLETQGLRNAQLTLLAPTGTIAFMMDCATTGIEPELGLVKYKKLSGGGVMKMVNPHVHLALTSLGYASAQIKAILLHIETTGGIEGSALKDEHLPVFDCSMAARPGGRTLPYRAHLSMMTAAQPYLSGAISKTINLPSTASVEDIERVYIEGWKMGLKCVAVYRDGCKSVEPYSASNASEKAKAEVEEVATAPARRPLPQECSAIRHRFVIHDGVNGGDHKGYLHVGCYQDGSPGEVFIRMAKEGSTVGGLMDGLAIAVSLALQYGVPVAAITEKFRHSRFPPFGFTDTKQQPELRMCSSVLDYLARFLDVKFCDRTQEIHVLAPERIPVVAALRVEGSSSPLCSACGSVTQRDGKCFVCPGCGASVGACSG